MPSNLPYPWIWLGFEKIYLKESARSPWDFLKQRLDTADEFVPWSMTVTVAGGEVRLHRCGERLGLGDDACLHELYESIVRALLAELNDLPVLFAPPAQLVGLTQVLRRLKRRPRALIADSLLFSDQAIQPAAGSGPTQEDAYIPDWRQPKQRIFRRFSPQQELRRGPLKPVLLSVQDYIEGEPQVLSIYLDKQQGMTPADIVLTIPPLLQRGRRLTGMGLVWAWGVGPRLWQWALPPHELPGAAQWSQSNQEHKWRLELRPPWSYRITAAEGSEIGELIPPVIYEIFLNN